MAAAKARIGIHPRLRQPTPRHRHKRECLKYVERKVHLVAEYPRKHISKYKSRSDIYEWEIYNGNRVFLRDAHTEGSWTLVIVEIGTHKLHSRHRRGKMDFPSVPTDYELLAA